MIHYDPQIYDLFHSPDADDTRFYVAHARACGGPVLELGAGTGRTLIPVAREGIEIHGLDLDEGMLARLRAKIEAEPEAVKSKVQTFAGDMRRFALPHRYAAIHIPFRAFLHNVDVEAQLACLRACHEHLVPGGALAFNIFHPSVSFIARHHDAYAGMWRWRGEQLAPDGTRVLRSDATQFDTVKQTASARHRFEVYGPDGLLLRTYIFVIEVAYLHPGDVRERLAAAGFVDVRIDGGFEGRPLEREGEEMVVRARRG